MADRSMESVTVRPVAGEKSTRVSFLRGDMHLMALRASFAMLVRLREKHELPGAKVKVERGVARLEGDYDPFNERSDEEGSLGEISSPVMETFLSIAAAESTWPSAGWSDARTSFRTWLAAHERKIA